MDEEFEGLPPGYKFSPTDEQALKDYLLPKLRGHFISPKIIRDFDIYLCEPQTLPGFTKGHKSFYFTPRERKHANGNRTSRCIKGRMDFWKMTSKITKIKDKNGSLLGRKSTLVYYIKGDAKQKATKTKYLMQEYVLDDCHKDLQTSDKLSNMVLCAIYLLGASETYKETQVIKESQQNWSDNMESPIRAVPKGNFTVERQQLSALTLTEYSPEQYLSDNMESPQSVLVPTDNSTLDEQQRLALVPNDHSQEQYNSRPLNCLITNYNPPSASIGEIYGLEGALGANDFVGQDFMGQDFMAQDFIQQDFMGQDLVGQGFMRQQSLGIENAIYGNHEVWPGIQSSVQPGVNSSRPSTLDEFIATGDCSLDLDNSSCIGKGSGNVIGESGLDFHRNQFQSTEVNEFNYLGNYYKQLCNL